MDQASMTMGLVCGYLDAQEWSYRLREDKPALETGVSGETCVFSICITVVGDPANLGVLIYLPMIVPEARRLEMAEAITRANYDLLNGCFELDFSDGELRYRASMPLADGTVTEEQFRELLFYAIAMADQYARAFNRLLYGDDLSPAEVIAEVEMAS